MIFISLKRENGKLKISELVTIKTTDILLSFKNHILDFKPQMNVAWTRFVKTNLNVFVVVESTNNQMDLIWICQQSKISVAEIDHTI